jgi:hypothetical protein
MATAQLLSVQSTLAHCLMATRILQAKKAVPPAINGMVATPVCGFKHLGHRARCQSLASRAMRLVVRPQRHTTEISKQ